jgi:hypothetical protein
MPKQKLTSVKVDEELFEKFKYDAYLDKFTFQKLADRSMYLYITDPDFRKRLQNQIDIKLDGK